MLWKQALHNCAGQGVGCATALVEIMTVAGCLASGPILIMLGLCWKASPA